MLLYFRQDKAIEKDSAGRFVISCSDVNPDHFTALLGTPLIRSVQYMLADYANIFKKDIGHIKVVPRNYKPGSEYDYWQHFIQIHLVDKDWRNWSEGLSAPASPQRKRDSFRDMCKRAILGGLSSRS